MATEEPVTQPLRISKNTPVSASPQSPANDSSIPRPLSEIPVTEKRRNSPSWKKSPKKMTITTDSSPFQSSPLDGTSSPRLFWQNRNGPNGNTSTGNENDVYGSRGASPSPTRRSSIERLQRASRVKNSTMYAREQKQEYDPRRTPVIERPLAKVQGNAFGGTGLAGYRSSQASHSRGDSQPSVPTFHGTHSRADSEPSPVTYSPRQSIARPPRLHTPPFLNRPASRDQASPTKSSLVMSRFKSRDDSYSRDVSVDTSFEEHELPSGKEFRRQMKSVTFDAAPPQVNEYDLATPDISSIDTNSRDGSYDSEEDGEEDGYGIYHAYDGEDHDESFDATLEDTDKTPVVGPGDDPFETSALPEAVPSQAERERPLHSRTNSITSSGDHRPLPPLPGMGLNRTHSPVSENGPLATPEAVLTNRRNLPTPPPVATAKTDTTQSNGSGKITLEDRLKLVMLSDEASSKAADPTAKTLAEQQRERRMRRAGPRDRVGSPTQERETAASEMQEEDDTLAELSTVDLEYELPTISRASILKRINGQSDAGRESEYNLDSSPAPSSPGPDRTPFDPDVPIASIEDSVLEEEKEGEEDDDFESDCSVVFSGSQGEQVEDVFDLYQRSEHVRSDLDLHGPEDDFKGHHSDDLPKTQPAHVDAESMSMAHLATPGRAGTPVNFNATLPLVTATHKDSEFSRSFQSYMLPKPKEPNALTHSESRKEAEEPAKRVEVPAAPDPPVASVEVKRPMTPVQSLTNPAYDGSGWGEPDGEEEDEVPGTPDSVIHHPVSATDYEDEDGEESREEGQAEMAEQNQEEGRNDLASAVRAKDEGKTDESPVIPERMATIKASGSKLKTRPSATPSDLVTMREQRRQVSREVPPISSRLPQITGGKNDGTDRGLHRQSSFRKHNLTLDLDLGLSLDQDFDRVMEASKVAFQQASFAAEFLAASGSPSRQASGAQTASRTAGRQRSKEIKLNANITARKQRGYLMRQNTKLVAASDKESEDARPGHRSAGNSPVKQATRPMSWTVQPWNGKVRAASVKKSGLPITTGPVPPLPGQESNAVALDTLAEEEPQAELATEECGERGRLFVKVMGVKDLDLPLPKNERSWFSLTLDNGVHCVTTAWLELARNAPIGQEFELVVPDDLEFQLTLNVKLDKPEPKRLPPPPVKAARPKASTFSRVFASPKKRKEMEARMKAEDEAYAQAQRAAAAMQRNAVPTAWDLLSPLAAEDGSFARSYVCLKEHESRCYGRPHMVEIAAFNEWATEEASFASSVKSKRSGNSSSVLRRAPYKIGKLEVQLLFVPRPKGATEEDMPKSMNSCIREMKAAEERLSRNWEGPLSQQGGDCPYWRRRYFKLVGTKLTAYHESTRQPRATINLANAKRLIDDRHQLTNPETMGKGGKRRRSGFAEEEEGYMFVEEGFRIRFRNGEVIDFYADARQDKEGWMKVLQEVVGRIGDEDEANSGTGASKKWCDLILKREEALRRRAESRQGHGRAKSMII